jgi:hypothetical protein
MRAMRGSYVSKVQEICRTGSTSIKMALQFTLRTALEQRRFDRLAIDEFDDERDALLTLLDIYALSGEPDPRVGAMKLRLEAWLIGNLQARIPGDITETMGDIAARSYDAAYEWLATSADPGQVRVFHDIANDEDVRLREKVPVSALFRAAVKGLLATNEELQPERLGAEALLALRAGERTDVDQNDPRVIRGARWQGDVDARFFRDLHTLLATRELRHA